METLNATFCHHTSVSLAPNVVGSFMSANTLGGGGAFQRIGQVLECHGHRFPER